MAKFQSPLLGYNNNVRHKNRVFHIQTEDSGVNHPHIITHLFMDGGRILKSVKKSYAEHVGAEGMQETVRGLMKEQHKAIFIALRDGQFDALVEGGTAPRSPASEPLASATSATKLPAAAPPAAGAAAVVAAHTGPAPAASTTLPPAAARLSPISVQEPKHPEGPMAPPASAAEHETPRLQPVSEAPMTTRPRDEARLESAMTGSDAAGATAGAQVGGELTLDFDALDKESHETIAAPSLFHTTDLPPPPKNLFAKEAGTGGAYRAVEANAAHEARSESQQGARVELVSRGSEPRREAALSKPPGLAPPNRPSSTRTAEARYAPARPAAIFGSAQRGPPKSIFSDELISDKSLDEVILSYLAEDLEAPRRK